MSLDTYANLLSAVADWFADSSLSSQAADGITMLEAELNRTLRVRRMESLDTSTSTVAGTQNYAWPTGFLECRHSPYIVRTGIANQVLEYATPSRLQEMDDARGNDIPSYWTDYLGQLYLWPKPIASLSVYIPFYKKLNIASDSTNWLLTNHPDVYLYGALTQLGAYETESERLALWASKYAAGLQAVKDEDRRIKGGPQPVRIVPEQWGP